MTTLREAAEKALEALERTHSSPHYLNRVSDAKNFLLDALAEPETTHRLMRKEGAAWIPASEWLTGAPDKSWIDLVASHPAEWRIAEPIDGKTFSDALGKALRPEPEPVAWRMRDTGFKKAHYCYYDTKAQAEADAAQVLQSRDDGHLTNLTPLYTRPQE